MRVLQVAVERVPELNRIVMDGLRHVVAEEEEKVNSKRRREEDKLIRKNRRGGEPDGRSRDIVRVVTLREPDRRRAMELLALVQSGQHTERRLQEYLEKRLMPEYLQFARLVFYSGHRQSPRWPVRMVCAEGSTGQLNRMFQMLHFRVRLPDGWSQFPLLFDVSGGLRPGEPVAPVALSWSADRLICWQQARPEVTAIHDRMTAALSQLMRMHRSGQYCMSGLTMDGRHLLLLVVYVYQGYLSSITGQLLDPVKIQVPTAICRFILFPARCHVSRLFRCINWFPDFNPCASSTPSCLADADLNVYPIGTHSDKVLHLLQGGSVGKEVWTLLHESYEESSDTKLFATSQLLADRDFNIQTEANGRERWSGSH